MGLKLGEVRRICTKLQVIWRNSTFVADVRTPLTLCVSRERIMLLRHDSERSRQGPLVQVRLGFAAPSFCPDKKSRGRWAQWAFHVRWLLAGCDSSCRWCLL